MSMPLCRLTVPCCAAGEMLSPVNATSPRRSLPRVLDPAPGGLLGVPHPRPHHLIRAFRAERPGKEEPKLCPHSDAVGPVIQGVLWVASAYVLFRTARWIWRGVTGKDELRRA